MKLALTDEERQALLRLINDALASPRFPLSPELGTLRRVRSQLQGKDKARPPRR